MAGTSLLGNLLAFFAAILTSLVARTLATDYTIKDVAVVPRADMSSVSPLLIPATEWVYNDNLSPELGRRQDDEEVEFEPVMNDLENGQAGRLNIQFGQAEHWRLPFEALQKKPAWVEDKEEDDATHEGQLERPDLRRRQEDSARLAYLTFNTCLQPQPNSTLSEDDSFDEIVPQLRLFLSNDSNNKRPGPDVDDPAQIEIPIIQGYANYTMNVTSDWWIGVYAEDLSSEEKQKWSGVWNYELAVSTEGKYHELMTRQSLYWIDSDSNSALLITGNMTDDVEPTYLPYVFYAQSENVRAKFKGIENSYCAVSQLAQIGRANVASRITERGLGNLPKQQIHVTGLNKSSTYFAYLAKPGNASVGTAPRGGKLWTPIRLATKGEGNCQVIFDLPFCSEVAYAVPSNPTLFDTPQKLAAFYDAYADSLYKNFTYSLNQYPCEAPSTSRYSLTRDCNDCAKAYKEWLCAVTIPRCADFSSSFGYLAPRALDQKFFNATSQTEISNPKAEELLNAYTEEEKAVQKSRNPRIDEFIKPGPYKEIKPCIDLCYTLVQSCPSNFGFSCPQMGSWGQMGSYGERSDDGDVTCSWLGAAYFLSAGTKEGSIGRGLVLTVVVSLFALVL